MSVGDLVALGPFHNRPDEWALYQPLVGNSMLELGGKINAPFTYKAFFQSLGYRHVSIDWNGDHGALALDLRHPISLGQFDMVTNIGTSEHVDSQEGAWHNMVDACGEGSVLICTTPLPGGNDWWWHGVSYPEQAFYVSLAALNGFELERLYTVGEVGRRMWFVRLVRHTVTEFVMPTGEIYQNVIRPR